MDYNFTLADLFKAYFDCRRNKRCKHSALKFEVNLERNLLRLYKEIKSGRYKIGRSMCFVVTKPKPREVWAANFRDRIVHHLIYNFISERFHKRFIRDTYSCIPGRGTLAAAKRLRHFARSATKNYSKNMFYLKADLSNFFVSINKDILFELVKKQVSEEWILALVKQIIYNDPTKNAFIKSSRKKFNLIPRYKSLFYADKNHGLPIGNLTSQFFSNVYLDVLDKFVKKRLKCKYYVRYVDDFIIIDQTVSLLNLYFFEIKLWLEGTIKLKLNPRKKLVNKVSAGMDFVGFYVKPGRLWLRTMTIARAFTCIKNWRNSPNRFQNGVLAKFLSSVNSYLGMFKHVSGAVLAFDFAHIIDSLFISVDCSKLKAVMAGCPNA